MRKINWTSIVSTAWRINPRLALQLPFWFSSCADAINTHLSNLLYSDIAGAIRYSEALNVLISKNQTEINNSKLRVRVCLEHFFFGGVTTTNLDIYQHIVAATLSTPCFPYPCGLLACTWCETAPACSTICHPCFGIFSSKTSLLLRPSNCAGPSIWPAW